jgi:hypothetical protein
MDWVIVVELVKALAWPVVVVILALTARPIIRGVADRIKKLKAAGAEIELGDVPRPPELPPPPDQKALPAPPEVPQLEPSPPPAEPDLVRFAPDGAVVNAWARLEEAMRREAVRHEVVAPNEGQLVVPALIRRLKDAGVVDSGMDIAESLRRLRNDAVHAGKPFTEDAAVQFVQTVDGLIQLLEQQSDRKQLARIFKTLRVNATDPEELKQVVVGPLTATGTSGDPEVAAQIARVRGGHWGARYKGVTMMISERDAALLRARGALMGNPEAK